MEGGSSSEVDVSHEKSKEFERRRSEKEVELVHDGGSIDGRLLEVERREKEVGERERDLVSQKEALSAERDRFVRDLELANDKLRERENLGFRSIEKLDAALQALEGTKTALNARIRSMESTILALKEVGLARRAEVKQLVERRNREREFSLSEEANKESLIRDFLAWHKLQNQHKETVPLFSSKVEPDKKPNTLCLRELCEAKQKKYSTDSRVGIEGNDNLEKTVSEMAQRLDLTGDEIFKIVTLPSDAAAKSALQAMKDFYHSYLKKGDVEVKSWKKCLLLLYQLHHKPPKNVEPCVREEANKLAIKWESKMKKNADDSVTFGFLMFLAVYNLPHCLSEEELLIHLKKVAHFKEALELCRKLGSSEAVLGFIKGLIDRNQYLLASTYIHESQLQQTFPQSMVLNQFVRHSKMLAKRQRERGNDSYGAQVEAISSEIADLTTLIKHIKKYGLQFEYSPVVLKKQLRRLVKSRAKLMKDEIKSSSTDNSEKVGELFLAPKTLSASALKSLQDNKRPPADSVSLPAHDLKKSDQNCCNRAHKIQKTNPEMRPEETHLIITNLTL